MSFRAKKGRKRTGILAVLCVLVILFNQGCGAAETTQSGQTDESFTGVEFTDALGRTVTLEEVPLRTAALIGSFASVWTLAGGTVCATANDAWTDFDLDLNEDVVNLGKSKDISLELLLASDPDFVIASVNTQIDLDLRETLESAGITVAYFEVSTIDDYVDMLRICTQITGRSDLYETNGTEVAEQVQKVIESAQEMDEHPTVLYVRASAGSVSAKSSEGNVLGGMLRDLGCINIADSDNQILENLSMEAIMEKDPDYIFIVRQGSDTEGIEQSLSSLLTGNPAWESLTAVQEGRVYEMDQRLYNLKPNERWGEAYEKLAEILFGDDF